MCGGSAVQRRRLQIAFATLLASAGLSGCLLESHPVTDPLPLDAFCGAFFDALCEPIEDCDCPDAAVRDCRDEERALCSTFPSPALRAAIDAAEVHYDGAAAAALIRRMRGRADGCQGFIASLDWQVRDLFALGGVFEGDLGAGAACEPLGFELVSACRLGACAPDGAGHSCRASVSEGERCDRLHQCVDLDGTLTPERGIERLALRCAPDAPGSEVGTCVPWVELGGPCDADTDCWSSRCEERRCVASPVGAPCRGARDCESGHCDASARCAPGDAPVGAPCASDAACASHVCVGGACLDPGCGVF